MDDVIKSLNELPAGADITTREWSWYFADGKGAIRHCSSDGVITAYEFPLAVVQVIQQVSKHDVAVVQHTIKRALGLPLN